MKKLLIPLLLLSLLATVLLVACDPPLTSGYVYDKQYSPPYSSYVPGYTTRSCSKVGKSQSCYTYYHPGYVVYEPAEYYLRLTTCSDLKTIDDPQGCKTGWVSVDEYVYDHTAIGSYYQQ